ncbi:MAG: PorV/PorQ family protein [bacterium]|nr:PorV/PorQ family protein [bacterium]
MKNKIKIKRIITIIILLQLYLAASTWGSDNAGAFLEKSISPGATALGMSYVSFAKNSAAAYWNPAALTKCDATEIYLMGTKAFETQYLSLQTSVKSFLGLNWGFSYIGAYLAGIYETTRHQSYDRHIKTGNSLSYGADAYLLSTAREIAKDISFGLTAKYINEKAATKNASGFGLDLGVLYTPHTNIALGINLQNILATDMAWDTESKNVDRIPLTIRAGGSIWLSDRALLATIDLNKRTNRPLTLHVGVEYWLCSYFALRAGLDQGELSLGTGLNLEPFILDFAWTNPSADFIEDLYKFSIGYRF